MGHRKIAFLHGQDCTSTRDRLAGFRQACQDLGLTIPEEYIIPCAYHDPDLCEQEARRLLQLPEPPTCILFPDDFSFVGGHNAMLEAGLVIPSLDFEKSRSLSAMGYDGFTLARVINLITYSQNALAIGKTAAEQLIRRIEHPDAFQPQQILISGELLKGRTVLDLNNK